MRALARHASLHLQKIEQAPVFPPAAHDQSNIKVLKAKQLTETLI